MIMNKMFPEAQIPKIRASSRCEEGRCGVTVLDVLVVGQKRINKKKDIFEANQEETVAAFASSSSFFRFRKSVWQTCRVFFVFYMKLFKLQSPLFGVSRVFGISGVFGVFGVWPSWSSDTWRCDVRRRPLVDWTTRRRLRRRSEEKKEQKKTLEKLLLSTLWVPGTGM